MPYDQCNILGNNQRNDQSSSNSRCRSCCSDSILSSAGVALPPCAGVGLSQNLTLVSGPFCLAFSGGSPPALLQIDPEREER